MNLYLRNMFYASLFLNYSLSVDNSHCFESSFVSYSFSIAENNEQQNLEGQDNNEGMITIEQCRK